MIQTSFQEEEERKRKEEQEQKEHEEYLLLKEQFTVEEEGVGETAEEVSLSSQGFLVVFVYSSKLEVMQIQNIICACCLNGFPVILFSVAILSKCSPSPLCYKTDLFETIDCCSDWFQCSVKKGKGLFKRGWSYKLF